MHRSSYTDSNGVQRTSTSVVVGGRGEVRLLREPRTADDAAADDADSFTDQDLVPPSAKGGKKA